MLIEFSVTNFRSVRSRQTLSLVASADVAHQKSNTAATDSKDMRLLRSAVVYGPNAAGKSNLLRALETLRQLVQNSSTATQEGQRLPLTPFLLADQSREEPSSFEVVFEIDGTRFEYCVEASAERITKEWMVAYPLGRPQRWFEREYKAEKSAADWWFGPHFKGERKQRQVWQNSTRSNALFLSTAVQLNNEQLRPVFDWIVHKLIVLVPGVQLNPFLSLEMLRQDESRLRVMRFMQAAGIDIDRLELREEEGTVSLPPAMQGFARLFVQGQPQSQQRIWRVLAWHKCADGGEEVAFDFFDESDGTQKLFEFVGGWLHALDSGATLFVDELDRSLHPKLTRYLVELFNSDENRKNAQLVFTTHDTTLLDPELLRRDQIWFVEKSKERSSHVYSLLEFSPRKDEALERGYLKGRYGAIPLVGRWEW
jgi:AAA15 family ATPase/GTPase